MDATGISMISAKPLKTEAVGNVYTNVAFNPDDVSKSGSVSSLNNATNNNSNNNVASSDKSTGETFIELPPPKRDASSVDFTLPTKHASKEASRDRLKSISEGPYRGMGKEELLRYSSRPMWRNLRYVCMSIVLTGWLALLITVVALVLTYPHCRKAQEREWWQKTVIYRIYVRSFHDSDSDGYGDINGITQKLDYLHNLGVDTIALSPIYKMSATAETDTHIVDHQDIDPVFGTIEQFQLLVNETHKKGMHITLDFIPNHTSDEHQWFIESAFNKDAMTNEYRSYYVWAEGRGGNSVQTPNSWKSVYDCSAWEKSSDNTFYLHQFLKTQPELNLRSEKVRDALEEILHFWLSMGVDGFYIRDSEYLFEDYDLRDDYLVDNTTTGASQRCSGEYPYSAYEHVHTRGLSEVYDMFARWRAYLDDYGNRTNKYRILFADVDGSYQHVMNYYGLFNRDGVDFPLNKFSTELNSTAGGKEIGNLVSNWITNMPPGRWANWMGGDDRVERLADRLGDDMAGPYLILSMLLPGTPYLYYGDEIGLRSVSPNVTEPWSRQKPMRGPMQWNNKTHAGFCLCVHPWMDINPAYKNQMNAEAMIRNPESIWNLFKNLTSLRKDNPSFEYGFYVPIIQDEEVFSFVREFDGEKGYLVALNFANSSSRKYFEGAYETIPGGATVEIVTGKNHRHRKGSSADLSPLTLAPYEGVVVSWDYEAKEL